MAHVPLESPFQKFAFYSYDHASISADTTIKLEKFDRRCAVAYVSYVNPTGLAQDAVNFVNVRVMNDAVVVANWSTETGQEGTLAADTFVELVRDSDAIFEAGEEMVFDVDVSGVQTLPPGRINIRVSFF